MPHSSYRSSQGQGRGMNSRPLRYSSNASSTGSRTDLKRGNIQSLQSCHEFGARKVPDFSGQPLAHNAVFIPHDGSGQPHLLDEFHRWCDPPPAAPVARAFHDASVRTVCRIQPRSRADGCILAIPAAGTYGRFSFFYEHLPFLVRKYGKRVTGCHSKR